MANGGIIGPVNDPTSSDIVTSFTSSGTLSFGAAGISTGKAIAMAIVFG